MERQDGDIMRKTMPFAYHQMLTGPRYFYPNAKIVCATLMKTTLKQNRHWRFFDRLDGINIDDYNKAILRAASNCHVSLTDLAKRKRLYETLDGTHPTVIGHQIIAEEWIGCLSKNIVVDIAQILL